MSTILVATSGLCVCVLGCGGVVLAENKVFFSFQVPAPARRHRNLILRLRHSKHSSSTNMTKK